LFAGIALLCGLVSQRAEEEGTKQVTGNPQDAEDGTKVTRKVKKSLKRQIRPGHRQQHQGKVTIIRFFIRGSIFILCE
jgi:hypothetical protein